MVDRPITFRDDNVRCMLAGKKTQTRRLAWKAMPRLVSAKGATIWQRVRPGDRFWVREPFHTDTRYLRYSADDAIFGDWQADARAADIWTRARGIHSGSVIRPARYLPKWASRLILPVAGVRREPLHAITDEDAIAEGIVPGIIDGKIVFAHFGAWNVDTDGNIVVRLSAVADSPRLAYGRLWDELHGPGAWDRNPEVMVFTFTVQQAKIAEAA